jgi:uncharacterized protein YfaT (DUF1175 family)
MHRPTVVLVRLVLCVSVVPWLLNAAERQTRLADESDRRAFRSWFTLLADAQFYRPTRDVTDCAALVRHAVREALRPHRAAWLQEFLIPGMPTFPDVRHAPPVGREGHWPLFLTASGEAAEFADARTIVRYNSRALGRSATAARSGDLLYFHQADASSPDHLMVFVGPSVFDRSANDWVVYHTGPDGADPGEVRKVRLADLLRHPAPRWRPLAGNPAFVGLFRLLFL